MAEKNPRHPMPTWFKWALLAFLGYAVMNNMTGGGTQKVIDQVQGTTPAEEGKAPTAKNTFARLARSVWGAPTLHVIEVKDGKGEEATCGQDVEIRYTVYSQDGEKLFSNTKDEKPLRYRLGQNTQIPALERALIGMKVGGIRRIAAPPVFAYGSEQFQREDIPANAPIGLEVKLKKVSPILGKEGEPLPGFYRWYDVKQGAGDALSCGSRVALLARVLTMDNKVLYDTGFEAGAKPLLFVMGKDPLPYGIQKALIGMLVEGRRSVLMGKEYARLFPDDFVKEASSETAEENKKPKPDIPSTDAKLSQGGDAEKPIASKQKTHLLSEFNKALSLDPHEGVVVDIEVLNQQ